MLKAINPNDIPGRGRENAKGAWKEMITEFLESDIAAAEVEEKNIKVETIYNGLKVANARMGNPVQIAFRQKKVYLIKKEE